MIFVDTWAWIALADDTDQHHAAVVKQHRKLLKKARRYVTTNEVVGELIDFLYDDLPESQARQFICWPPPKSGAGNRSTGSRLPRSVPARLADAAKYHDKPDISFVDFTSMVVMQDLGMTDVFTGDNHFRQVNLGFRLLP